MSVENGKVCCNCRHNIRKADKKYGTVCYCEIRDYNMSYAQVMEGWCRRWAKRKGEGSMTIEDARYYLRSSGFGEEQISTIEQAFKQEPCDDAISRSEVIKSIDEREDVNGKVDAESVRTDIVLMPSVTPQPKTGWIPVSKGLPKENGWYQCTVILNDLPRTMDLFYKNGKWLDNRRINMFDTYDIYGYGNTNEKHKLSYQELISEFEWMDNVTAWMPLPSCYESQESEE